MWNALRSVHEGYTAGTRMYWLEKLVTFKMDGDKISSELDWLESLSEQLGALVSAKRPLTVDEITCMVICLSLPSSFKPVTASFLQHESISLAVLLSTVREELTRLSISHMHTPRVETVSVAHEKKRDDCSPRL